MLRHQVLVRLAQQSGLELVGAVPAGPARSLEAYRAWIEAGYAGGMDYLTRPDAVARRADPRRILPEARTVLVVGASYAGAPLPPPAPLQGRVARYAWGEDYHRWLLRRLKSLVRRIEEVAGPFSSRCYVDTGPLLERDWAEAAGLGWLGKNSNLIHPTWGSYLFLGVALLSIEVEPPAPETLPSCGTCTRCLGACPTGALVAPGVIDARRCLSYLTIEHRGAIPPELRPALGERVFGCDRCQEVCPWNRQPPEGGAQVAAPPNATLYLPDLLTLDAAGFRARFRRTPLWRATPEGLARNAAVVLGNLGDLQALPILERTAESHTSALVREHAAGALRRLRGASRSAR
ncbi:MAG: tRNA epoxyqueuosine(34) reductase QueG [Anaerolineales bacterium]